MPPCRYCVRRVLKIDRKMPGIASGLDEDVASEIRVGRIMLHGVEGDEQRPARTRVLEGMGYPRREGESDQLAVTDLDLVDLPPLADAHEGRPLEHRHLGASVVIVIASNASRLRDGHMDIALGRDEFWRNRLHHPAPGIGVRVQLFRNDARVHRPGLNPNPREHRKTERDQASCHALHSHAPWRNHLLDGL